MKVANERPVLPNVGSNDQLDALIAKRRAISAPKGRGSPYLSSLSPADEQKAVDNVDETEPLFASNLVPAEYGAVKISLSPRLQRSPSPASGDEAGSSLQDPLMKVCVAFKTSRSWR